MRYIIEQAQNGYIIKVYNGVLEQKKIVAKDHLEMIKLLGKELELEVKI